MLGEGFPGSNSGKEPGCQCKTCKRLEFHPWGRKLPWRGNDNPLQYSYLGNPTDRGASWATVHGVAKSRTQLIDRAFTQPGPLPLSSPSPFQLSNKRHCIFFCKGFGEDQLQVTDSPDVKENRGGEWPGWLTIVLPEGRPVPEQQLGCDHL